MFRNKFLPALMLALLTIVALFVATPFAAAAPATQPADKSIIAVFDLSGALTEQPVDDGLAGLTGPVAPSLREVVMRMKKAAADPAVKAVVLLADDGSFGEAQIEELRQAIQKIRAAGKEVYAHSDSMMMGEYALLCGASRVSLAPTADLWLTGIAGDEPYLKGLLDKLGIQPDFLHCGAYKSASEIFMREGPSPEAEAMENWLLDSEFDTAVHLIASGRKVGADQARKWIDQGPYTAEKAKAAGLIDAVEVRADFEATLKDKFGPGVEFRKHYAEHRPPQLDFSNPFSMFKTLADLMGGAKSSGPQKPAVGVVYVDGMIVLGKNDSGLFGSSLAASSDIAAALDKAANDDSIKAVVLRIDSPGGSAVASEIILHATERLKAKKPLVVSMGDVAGSGGYYVTCAADTIFADESTITASIGVVGGKFATTAMWNKIGVTFKAYQRGANAGLLSTDAIFTDTERQRMQAWMDDIYGVFKSHVVANRAGKLKKPIDDIDAGRVYTGRQALDLGLVDKIGTLSDAIEFAAAQAKMTDYDVRTVPEPKNFLEKLSEQAAGGDNDPGQLDGRIARFSPANSSSLLKLAAPYLAQIDRAHARSIEAALSQLQLMQTEGVIMMVPGDCVPGR
jgi:protease-4